MRKKIAQRALGLIGAALGLLLLLGAAGFLRPFHIDAAPDEVSKIFLAGDGGQVVLLNAEEAAAAGEGGARQIASRQAVNALLKNLSSVELRCVKPSGIGGRAQYTLIIYDRAGKILRNLFIADERNLDSGRFFCRASAGALDLDALDSYLES